MSHPSPRGLPDLCIELFDLAVQLQRPDEPDGSSLLLRKVKALFAELDRQAKIAEIDGEDAKLAQYAIAALIDEIVLKSSWSIRQAWAKRPLQLDLFNDSTAGEGFFHKLDELRGTRDHGKIDVLEVYATCLGLGFKGKYADPERAENPMLTVGEISREIKQARKQRDDLLSARWVPDRVVEQRVKAIPVWIVAAACAALVLFTVVLLDLRLSSEMGPFDEAVRANKAELERTLVTRTPKRMSK